MTELNDTLKERKRILQGVRKLHRVKGMYVDYKNLLMIIFDKDPFSKMGFRETYEKRRGLAK